MYQFGTNIFKIDVLIGVSILFFVTCGYELGKVEKLLDSDVLHLPDVGHLTEFFLLMCNSYAVKILS